MVKGDAKEVESKIVDMADKYYECADKHQGLIEAVKP